MINTKWVLAFFISTLLISFTLTTKSAGQDDGSVYLHIEYLYVSPENRSAYNELKQEIWKPVFEERIRQGLIKSWALYESMYNEPNANYSHMTVQVIDDFSKAERLHDHKMISTVFPEKDITVLQNRTWAIREFKHSEVWQFIDAIRPRSIFGRSVPFLVTNHMYVPQGKDTEFVQLETEFWKPLQQDRIDDDLIAGWELYHLIQPKGTISNYGFKTVDYYHGLGQLSEPFDLDFDMSLIYNAHPDISDDKIAENFERTAQARSVYRAILWRLVDSVN